ncbi:MAG: class I SAM-dependent RNA methyltransferase, partial [Oscillospiraceae bacterium]|nr:class I SAM-dependent RNA methyltransferase [Oscillospiraceae bacterium]
MKYTAVATCGFGLESVLAFEIKRLGAENVKTSDGRVTFDASGEDIARANLWLRTAERVLIILAEYPAPTFDALFDGAKAVPWGDVIDRADAFPVKGYAMNSALTSVPACQSIVKKAIVERLKRDHRTEFLPENNRVTKRVRFSVVKDVCTLMLDTSGDGLHKRGYRPLMNEAPIKETLAAGICDFARVFPDSAVCDPFCGSGTLLIEAALRAKNIAPGRRRAFAAEQYGFLGAGVFDRARQEADGLVRADAPFSGRGGDIDPAAVELARQNAKRAGVDDCVHFETADARAASFSENEVVLANPPYGERLMDERAAAALYADFGKNIFAQKIRGLYVIS